MGSHMGSMQYMPGMHTMGVDPRGMQSMYNSAPQSIPTHAHMHPHSRSYGADMGMGHHGMMNQAYDTSPQQHHSPLSAPASSPLMMHNSPQGAMHNPMGPQPGHVYNNGRSYPHTYEHHIMMDHGWPGQQTVHNGRMDGALHGLQRGGPQSMDLMYSPVDDLDDDVGIVDAEVLELLLSRPSL